ncbi:MAG: hypothetical protein J5905_06835 [Prevotella sp.]|nr:hypothetical protein [Prevotella sp.]
MLRRNLGKIACRSSGSCAPVGAQASIARNCMQRHWFYLQRHWFYLQRY